MYHSFMLISFGGDMDTFKLGGGGMVIMGGVLLLLLSIMVILNPFSVGMATVIVLAGVGLLIMGSLLCTLSFKMKNIDKIMEDELSV